MWVARRESLHDVVSDGRQTKTGNKLLSLPCPGTVAGDSAVDIIAVIDQPDQEDHA